MKQVSTYRAQQEKRSLFYLGAGLFAVALVCAVCLKLVLRSEQSFYWLLSLPFLFLAMGCGLRKVLLSVKQQKTLVNVYLLLKIGKILGLVAACLIYIILLQIELAYFLPVFFVFYLFYLVWETKYIFRYEKTLRMEML